MVVLVGKISGGAHALVSDRAAVGSGCRIAMVDDPDIFRAAKLLIDRHGEEAATFAAGRADLLLEEGDIDGSAVWRRILAAIEELQRGRREDEAVN
jgi:hypothetical protein